jgi:uncharacterized protein (TIGR01244 family)
MDIRALTPDYAVSPQIEPEDLPAIKAAGYVTIIDNRPDGEIPPHLHTPAMQAAAEALGLTFVVNPVIGGQLTMANVTAQADAMAASPGPVLAYCASGNRSSVVWALANAGKRPVDELSACPPVSATSLTICARRSRHWPASRTDTTGGASIRRGLVERIGARHFPEATASVATMPSPAGAQGWYPSARINGGEPC